MWSPTLPIILPEPEPDPDDSDGRTRPHRVADSSHLRTPRPSARYAPQRATDLHARYAQIDEELLAALERWEALSSR